MSDVYKMHVGGFDIGPSIGTGTCSKVHFGIGPGGKGYAVRVIDKNIDMASRTRIERGVKLQRNLTDKQLSNLPQIFRVLQSAAHVYVVMEIAHGGNLEQFIAHHGTLNEDMARRIVLPVLRTIVDVHDLNITHGSLCLEHILITGTMRVFLCGWGHAQEGSGSQPRQRGRDERYLAPETAENWSGPKPLDVWSLGVVLYRVLTGVFPFDSVADIHSRLEDTKLYAGLSEGAVKLLRKVFVEDPNVRCTAHKLIADPWWNTTQTVFLVRRGNW